MDLSPCHASSLSLLPPQCEAAHHGQARTYWFVNFTDNNARIARLNHAECNITWTTVLRTHTQTPSRRYEFSNHVSTTRIPSLPIASFPNLVRTY
jgi:hypothetical protein